MVTFRVIDNKIRPMGSGVSSSSIGAPSRSTITGALPKTSAPLSGGIIGEKHAINRLLEGAKKKKDEAIQSIRETKASERARDNDVVVEEVEIERKEVSEQQQGNINILKEKLKEIAIGKTKKQKEKNLEKKKSINDTLDKIIDNKWKVDNFNISNPEMALVLEAKFGGSKEAMKILRLISEGDYKKAKKLLEEKNERFNEAFAEKSKQDSNEAKEVLKDVGFTINTRGLYIPTEKTKEIATTEFNIPDLDAEEIAETQVSVPPKLSPTEVAILSKTELGRKKLREWGFAKPVGATLPSGAVLSGIINI